MLLDDFKNWLKINCDADKTAINYHSRIKILIDKYGETFSQQQLNEHLGFLKDKKSKSTGNSFINAFKKYKAFSKIIYDLPKQRTIDKRENQYINEKELQEIRNYVPSIFDKEVIQRDLALRILFYTGLRAEEFVKLKREFIHLDKYTMEIKNTKTKVDRTVPFPKDKKNLVVQDIKRFFDTEPEKINAFNMTSKQLSYTFTTIHNQLSFRIPLCPKLFRHSCAVHLILEGVALPTVKRILGHSKIETTMLYCEPNLQDILNDYWKKI